MEEYKYQCVPQQSFNVALMELEQNQKAHALPHSNKQNEYLLQPILKHQESQISHHSEIICDSISRDDLLRAIYKIEPSMSTILNGFHQLPPTIVSNAIIEFQPRLLIGLIITPELLVYVQEDQQFETVCQIFRESQPITHDFIDFLMEYTISHDVSNVFVIYWLPFFLHQTNIDLQVATLDNIWENYEHQHFKNKMEFQVIIVDQLITAPIAMKYVDFDILDSIFDSAMIEKRFNSFFVMCLENVDSFLYSIAFSQNSPEQIANKIENLFEDIMIVIPDKVAEMYN